MKQIRFAVAVAAAAADNSAPMEWRSVTPILDASGRPLGFNFGNGGGATLPNGMTVNFGGGGGVYYGKAAASSAAKEFEGALAQSVEWSNLSKEQLPSGDACNEVFLVSAQGAFCMESCLPRSLFVGDRPMLRLPSAAGLHRGRCAEAGYPSLAAADTGALPSLLNSFPISTFRKDMQAPAEVERIDGLQLPQTAEGVEDAVTELINAAKEFKDVEAAAKKTLRRPDDLQTFLHFSEAWRALAERVDSMAMRLVTGGFSKFCRMQHSVLTKGNVCFDTCNSPWLANLHLMKEGPCVLLNNGEVVEAAIAPALEADFVLSAAVHSTNSTLHLLPDLPDVESMVQWRQENERTCAAKAKALEDYFRVASQKSHRVLKAVDTAKTSDNAVPGADDKELGDISQELQKLFKTIVERLHDVVQQLYSIWKEVFKLQNSGQKDDEKMKELLSQFGQDLRHWLTIPEKTNADSQMNSEPCEMRYLTVPGRYCAEVCLPPPLSEQSLLRPGSCHEDASSVALVDDFPIQIGNKVHAFKYSILHLPESTEADTTSLAQTKESTSNMGDEGAENPAWMVLANALADLQTESMAAVEDGDVPTFGEAIRKFAEVAEPFFKKYELPNTVTTNVLLEVFSVARYFAPETEGSPDRCVSLTFDRHSFPIAVAVIAMGVASPANSCSGGDKVFEHSIPSGSRGFVYLKTYEMERKSMTGLSPPKVIDTDFSWNTYLAGSSQVPTAQDAALLAMQHKTILPGALNKVADPSLPVVGQRWPLEVDDSGKFMNVNKPSSSAQKDRWGDFVSLPEETDREVVRALRAESENAQFNWKRFEHQFASPTALLDSSYGSQLVEWAHYRNPPRRLLDQAAGTVPRRDFDWMSYTNKFSGSNMSAKGSSPQFDWNQYVPNGSTNDQSSYQKYYNQYMPQAGTSAQSGENTGGQGINYNQYIPAGTTGKNGDGNGIGGYEQFMPPQLRGKNSYANFSKYTNSDMACEFIICPAGQKCTMGMCKPIEAPPPQEKVSKSGSESGSVSNKTSGRRLGGDEFDVVMQ